MKKSLYITETRHSLVYKALILLFFPPTTSISVFQGVALHLCFLGLSSLGQKGKMNMDRIAAQSSQEFFLKVETLTVLAKVEHIT